MRPEVAERLEAWLSERLPEGARAFLATAREEIAAGVEPRRLGMLLGLATVSYTHLTLPTTPYV